MDADYYEYTTKWFDRLAAVYGVFDALVAGVRRRAVDVTNAGLGSRVLDVATGTGAQAFAYARRGYEVVGIDLSEAMLRRAQHRDIGAHAVFEAADAAHMPFPDDDFDVSCISFALHDMPQSTRERTLQEMARVTKPNGIVVIVDYAVPARSRWHALVFHVARYLETKYYPQFVTSDPRELFEKVGIEIDKEIPVLGGIGRITRGINKK